MNQAQFNPCKTVYNRFNEIKYNTQPTSVFDYFKRAVNWITSPNPKMSAITCCFSTVRPLSTGEVCRWLHNANIVNTEIAKYNKTWMCTLLFWTRIHSVETSDTEDKLNNEIFSHQYPVDKALDFLDRADLSCNLPRLKGLQQTLTESFQKTVALFPADDVQWQDFQLEHLKGFDSLLKVENKEKLKRIFSSINWDRLFVLKQRRADALPKVDRIYNQLFNGFTYGRFLSWSVADLAANNEVLQYLNSELFLSEKEKSHCFNLIPLQRSALTLRDDLKNKSTIKELTEISQVYDDLCGEGFISENKIGAHIRRQWSLAWLKAYNNEFETIEISLTDVKNAASVKDSSTEFPTQDAEIQTLCNVIVGKIEAREALIAAWKKRIEEAENLLKLTFDHGKAPKEPIKKGDVPDLAEFDALPEGKTKQGLVQGLKSYLGSLEAVNAFWQAYKANRNSIDTLFKCHHSGSAYEKEMERVLSKRKSKLKVHAQSQAAANLDECKMWVSAIRSKLVRRKTVDEFFHEETQISFLKTKLENSRNLADCRSVYRQINEVEAIIASAKEYTRVIFELCNAITGNTKLKRMPKTPKLVLLLKKDKNSPLCVDYFNYLDTYKHIFL